jgi:hypothetical protein
MLSPLNRSLVLGGFAVACFAATASAQVFSDGFDSYPVGPLEGNATSYGLSWKGWGGGNTFISQVSTDFASSPSNSAKLVYGCDTVAEFDELTGGNPLTTGQWVMTAEVYVPSNFDGRTYYIGLNLYDDPLATYQWSIQVAFDATVPGSPSIACDCGINGVKTAPIPVDTWVPCRWEIDLTADWVDFYYNGALVHGYIWTKGVFGSDTTGLLRFDAIDLYPEFPSSNGSEIYVDNIVIGVGGPTAPGVQFCPGDGVYASCPCIANNDGSMSGCDWSGNPGGNAGGALDAVGSNLAINSDTFLQATNINNNFGIFFAAPNALQGPVLGDGLRCTGGGGGIPLFRLIPPTVPGGNSATHTTPLQTLDPYVAPGITRHYQYWFRAPGSFCGTGSNTTNGYTIQWM